ncbi:MAG TPA: polysaccharide biosynthesis/export family protein, partial [Candidatus Acidoferrum sp.]|nr:polysaccharide biosynthesis/export family protein [Candidatus Acidoferrum sp.]
MSKRTLCILVLLLSPLLCAQDRARVQSDSTAYSPRHAPELSELAKDNLNRVAASSVQIREVLVRDAGLLVELKRWVAKEAADNGQVVEDSNLSDHAIFDRLDQDLAFRSIATRLLQRYGYLLPAANPDSTLGKQQELILKERARRLVQIEAQEDTESLKPEKDEQQQVQRTSECDTRDRNCQVPSSSRGPQERPRDTEPQAAPEVPRYSSDQPRTLQTEIPSDGSTPRQNPFEPQIELASSTQRVPGDLPSGSAGSNAYHLDELANLPGKAEYPGISRDNLASNNVPQSVRPTWKRPRTLAHDEDVEPVKMVRPANPYSDIPSLYDMYVQAAAWQRPAERFGVDVFRNTSTQPDVIPMDLPVGPDYVVGPGDSLAIDLWGSVSQRMVRLVDRQGRVPLPDTAPLLVSGKSLEEVQLDVQHALRSVFRNVSADVSVSRLRTVRVYVVGEVPEPGAYDISSLSTPLNALLAAGGITPRGSLRALRHFRGKQLIEQVDAYELLLHGVRSDMKRLENGDTLQVPPLGPQVTVDGMVRRPAVYELSSETTLA